MIHQGRHQRGISLIEAIVAMAIMAVGMLGILGIQATLRGNSDISKQRSEAVRIAQATMETRRAFSVLDTAAGFTAYADIQDAGPSAVAADAGDNASFTLQEVVDDFPTTGTRDLVAPYKSLLVNVGWRDRSGELQTVRLASLIAANAPEIAAALSAPATGSPVQGALGRHRSIPRDAVNQTGDGAGTSRFTPPGSGSVSWIFSNTSGFITQTCVLTVCTDINARLLAGYVRFATSAAPPTAADAAVPPDAAVLPGVGVIVTLADTSVIDCQEDTASSASSITYYCAVPLASGANDWDGRSTLTGLPLAVNAADTSALRYRVCRYTTSRWNTATPVVANEDHPSTYADVATALTNQNFLVIRAGNGSTPYTCPDDTGVLGRTFEHQP